MPEEELDIGDFFEEGGVCTPAGVCEEFIATDEDGGIIVLLMEL